MLRLSALAALLGLPVALQAQYPPRWTQPLEPFQIADDLYYVGTVALSAFLLTSEEGHVLIDPTLAETVPLVLDNIRSLGFSPSDVRYLLTSHAHYDHVAGLADMLRATGAELLVSRGDAPFIRSGRGFGSETGYPPAAPTRTIDHLDEVRVGELEVTAHVTAGHTPGCTTWSGTVAIDGEPLDFVSLCSVNVLPTYRLVGEDPTYPGHAADFCRSLAHLRSLDPDIFLGAHGIWFDLEEKLTALRAGNRHAFIDREGYRSYLDEAEERLEQVLAEQGHEGGCAEL